MSVTPDTGDLIYIDFNPQAGHEQAGHRPALVLSPASYTRITSLSVVVPVTGQKKGYAFEVAIPPGLKIQGVILSDHIKCLDVRARNARIVDKVPAHILDSVRQKLSLLIL